MNSVQKSASTPQRQITVAKGIIPDKRRLKTFLKMFYESEISKSLYHAKELEQDPLDKGATQVTLYIEPHADYLLRKLFKDGVLRHWQEYFKFELQNSA